MERQEPTFQLDIKAMEQSGRSDNDKTNEPQHGIIFTVHHGRDSDQMKERNPAEIV
jgi:hypothetical protein